MSDIASRIAGLSAEQRAALARRLQDAKPTATREPIAIVGVGCRFPGGANSADAYWRLLVEGTDAVTELPADRADSARLFDRDGSGAGAAAMRWGGFLTGIDRFDAAFFGISPREAQRLDPQQRLLLEVAWEALEDAGQDVDKLAGTKTGVFVGLHSTASDYFWMQFDRPDKFDPFTGTGASHNMVAGRLSYLWDLRGPAIVVDTACSSSLVAVHLACQSLRASECSVALAAGVNLTLSPLFTMALTHLQVLSPRGRCRAFDAGADGFVRSEGCGVVVLKRLSDAVSAGDTILGLIRGSATNQDGRTNGITAPNGHSQQAVIREALKDARLDPDDIGYIEAHGTGTPLGDPIELEALTSVFGGRRSAQPCALGSAKANLGHLEGAAGIAGLIKALLSLRHETYPPLALFESLNPHLTLEGTPFTIPTTPTPWAQASGPRRAGISSFGWSGTNAHVILEEAPPVPPVEAAHDDGTVHMLPLSARSEDALRALADTYREDLTSGPLAHALVRDICGTAAARRTHHDFRAAVAASSHAGLAEALASVARGEQRWDISTRRSIGGRAPRLGFVFCGQGSQYAGMAAQLLESSRAFATTVEQIDGLVMQSAGWSVIAEIRARDPQSRLDQTEFAQPVLFALQAGLAAEWHARGITPSFVVGHSVGEIAAAHVAGALTLEDSVRIAVYRARLMQRATGYGRMLSIAVAPRDAEEIAARSAGKLSVAAENGPRSCVLSGETAAINQVAADMERRGIAARLLPVNYAFHSRQMDPILRELRSAISGIAPQPPRVPIFSTVTGQLAESGDFSPDYWVRNVRQTVRFAPAIAAACRSVRTLFLEIGPHPVLAASIAECAGDAGHDVVTVPSLQRGRLDAQSLAAGLGALYTAGCTIDWSASVPAGSRVVKLPAYPWQRQRYWIPEPGERRAGVTTAPGETNSLLGRRLRSPLFASTVFETTLGGPAFAYLADHRIHGDAVCPASAYVALACQAAAAVLDGWHFELRDLVVQQPLILRAPRTVQTIVHRDGDHHRFEICSLASDTANTWTTHVQGTIVSSVERALSAPTPPPDDDGGAIDPVTHYDAFESRGLSFGPLFRCITSFVRQGWIATAELALPEDLPSRDVGVHPVLLDGAFHAAWAAMPVELVNDVAYLPFSIERVRFFGPMSRTARAEGRRRKRIPAGGETLTGDVSITGADGSPVAEITGFTMKRASGDISAAARRRAIRSWFYEPSWTPQPVAESSVVTGDWIVAGEAAPVAAVGAALAACGGRLMAVTAGANCGAEIATLLKKRTGLPPSGIVLLCDGPGTPPSSSGGLVAAQASACALVTSVIQAIVASTSPPLPALTIVTRGAQQILDGPAAPLTATHTPLWGLARAVRMELPELRCSTIDLDPLLATAAQAAVAVQDILGASVEPEVAIRGGVRMVRRLTRVDPAPATAAESAAGPVTLGIPVRGVLDNLALEPAVRRRPGPGEIEIEIKAAGLNFRDVLNALGMYPGDAGSLGSECAGTVVAIGDGVTDLRPGDDVIAVGEGTLGNYVTTPALLASRKPERLSYAEAASLPITFLTVHEALIVQARLSEGDRILIHSAAGGVGLAAIQVALAAGAEVFATAGSPQKREFLTSLGVQHVMDSRTLDFAHQIIDATGGAGVDVVLNSLSGEFIERSLAVVAQNGRFVELGKIGIWTPERVAQFRKDIEYSVLYLGDFFVSDPARIRRGLDLIGTRVAAGELEPLPVTTFRLAEAPAAFRYMAQAHHVGKIVLTPSQPLDDVLRSDATYLITGGLGALGLAVAEWMVRRGARHVLLAGRSAPSARLAQQIAAMGRTGAHVRAVQCDVANTDDVARVVREVQTTGPALRGVVHAAGVLDDGVVLQQTSERFAKVLAPKAAGAWNLHRATADTPLDFLVFFSSIASMLGSAGQSNYAAANAFLDSFATALRFEGVPATSVSWGTWAEAGMAETIGDRNKQRWAAQGLSPIGREDGVAALEMAITSGIAHLGILSVDWERYGAGPSAATLRPLIGHLVETRAASPQSPEKPVALVDRLRRLPAGQRRAMLQQHVRDLAVKVLGLPAGYALDAQQGLRDAGLDSLLAIELRNALQADAQAALPATLAFDYPTIDALTGFLAGGAFASLMSGGATAAAAAVPDAPADDLDDLTDEQAAALLLTELSGIRSEGRI